MAAWMAARSLRSLVRASSRMASPSASLRRSLTYARCVLYGSLRGGAVGVCGSFAGGEPRPRAVPRVRNGDVGREARPRLVTVGAVEGHPHARSRFTALGLS